MLRCLQFYYKLFLIIMKCCVESSSVEAKMDFLWYKEDIPARDTELRVPFLCCICSKRSYPHLEWKLRVFKLLENGIWFRLFLRKALYFSWNWQNNELNADSALTWQTGGTNIVCWRIIRLQPWTLTVDYSVKKRHGWLVGFSFVSYPRGQNVIFVCVRKWVYSLSRFGPVYTD